MLDRKESKSFGCLGSQRKHVFRIVGFEKKERLLDSWDRKESTSFLDRLDRKFFVQEHVWRWGKSVFATRPKIKTHVYDNLTKITRFCRKAHCFEVHHDNVDWCLHLYSNFDKPKNNDIFQKLFFSFYNFLPHSFLKVIWIICILFSFIPCVLHKSKIYFCHKCMIFKKWYYP